jgi:YjbE family integral membrane protein
MMDFHQPGFWAAVGEIIVINILLSGDNAVVIALACRSLPQPQRRWGMIIGAGVASVLLILFTGAVAALTKLPYLKMAGSVALLWIAVRLLDEEEDDAEGKVEAAETLWRAVRIVVVADIIMSLDNVIAVAMAAKGSFILLCLGLSVSIPIVIAGSALIMWVLRKFPLLVWGGAMLLGWIAGDIFASDPAMTKFFDAATLAWLEIAAQVCGVAIVLGFATLNRRRRSLAEHS